MITALANTASTTATARAARPSPEEMFKKLDSGGKGYLTQDDLVKISPKGAEAASSAESAESAKAAEAFKRMDSDGDGKVTESEFKQAAPPEGQAPAAAKGGGKGPPPAGGGAGAGPAPAPAASASSSQDEIDPADANQDGKVSQQEQLAYDAQQQAGKLSSKASEAVKRYEAVAQAEA